jgi:hypothetical protein
MHLPWLRAPHATAAIRLIHRLQGLPATMQCNLPSLEFFVACHLLDALRRLSGPFAAYVLEPLLSHSFVSLQTSTTSPNLTFLQSSSALIFLSLGFRSFGSPVFSVFGLAQLAFLFTGDSDCQQPILLCLATSTNKILL